MYSLMDTRLFSFDQRKGVIGYLAGRDKQCPLTKEKKDPNITDIMEEKSHYD